MSVADGLRRTRVHSGVSLRVLALRTGIAKPNLSAIERARREPTSATIDRVALALGVTFVPVKTGGRNTVAEASGHVAAALEAGDTARAYRAVVQIADDLQTANPYLRALLAAEPAGSTRPGWDAFIASVTEWRLAEVGLPAPDWVLETIGAPDVPWAPPDAVLEARLEHVAEPFRRRGVLIEASELESA